MSSFMMKRRKILETFWLVFTVLMFGMNTMSGAVKPLAEVPEFTNILLKFSNPVLGVLAGALLTAVIQSSSASVGILQALCVTGAVRYGAALPDYHGTEYWNLYYSNAFFNRCY